MKVIVLDGTHNKKGMTMTLVDSLLRGITTLHPNAEIKKYDLLNEDVQFCKGCGSCTYDRDPIMAKCSIKDAADQIKKDALECDILVFATPIYEYAVSSVMKRFAERCLPLATFKFGVVPRAKSIRGKRGIIICTSGAPNPINHLMGITLYPSFILKLLCKMFRCDKIDSIFAGGMAINDKIRNGWVVKANKLGKKAALNFIN